MRSSWELSSKVLPRALDGPAVGTATSRLRASVPTGPSRLAPLVDTREILIDRRPALLNWPPNRPIDRSASETDVPQLAIGHGCQCRSRAATLGPITERTGKMPDERDRRPFGRDARAWLHTARRPSHIWSPFFEACSRPRTIPSHPRLAPMRQARVGSWCSTTLAVSQGFAAPRELEDLLYLVHRSSLADWLAAWRQSTSGPAWGLCPGGWMC